MTELSALFRQYADTFAKDIATFDKARNLPCAIMGVGEVHSSTLKVGENCDLQGVAIGTGGIDRE